MRIFVVFAALFLVGCQTATQNTTTAQGPSSSPPANYRQLAIDHVKKTFFDPYSIRDAEISAPKLAAGPSLNSNGFNTPWVVCIRANAKNRMGAYTGRKVTAIALSDSGVVNSWDEMQYSQTVCGDVSYERFPEIEVGYQPPAIPKDGGKPKA